jgi:hypothetical protein
MRTSEEAPSARLGARARRRAAKLGLGRVCRAPPQSRSAVGPGRLQSGHVAAVGQNKQFGLGHPWRDLARLRRTAVQVECAADDHVTVRSSRRQTGSFFCKESSLYLCGKGVDPRGLEPPASAIRGRFDVTVQVASSVAGGRGAA